MKKAIVIGATSGIGRELVKLLVQDNYKVGITGIENDLLEQMQKAYQGKVISKYLDCTVENTAGDLEKLIAALGGLDLMVFSAGIGNLNKNQGYRVENKANRLNVLGFTEIADWSYRFFEKQGHGHLVAISSIAGIRGYHKAPAYHAAKAYQIIYLESLRQKARKTNSGIRITDIRPGFVKTDMTSDKKVFWAAPPEKASRQIYHIIRKRKSIGYVTHRWQLIAFAARLLPSWVHERV